MVLSDVIYKNRLEPRVLKCKLHGIAVIEHASVPVLVKIN